MNTYFSAEKKALSLHDVLNNNMGQKDRHQGLFDIWGAIFRVSLNIRKFINKFI